MIAAPTIPQAVSYLHSKENLSEPTVCAQHSRTVVCLMNLEAETVDATTGEAVPMAIEWKAEVYRNKSGRLVMRERQA